MRRRSLGALSMRRRLLLLGCSERKRRVRGSVPAIDLYDGPHFRSLRRLQMAGSIPSDVIILSAKYGLLRPQDLIHDYDRRLNPECDGALVSKIRRQLQRLKATARPRSPSRFRRDVAGRPGRLSTHNPHCAILSVVPGPPAAAV